jgi:hypothetical protein
MEGCPLAEVFVAGPRDVPLGDELALGGDDVRVGHLAKNLRKVWEGVSSPGRLLRRVGESTDTAKESQDEHAGDFRGRGDR